jgi:signal peptidase
VKAARKIVRVLVHWLLPLIAFGIIVAGVLFVAGVFPYKVYIIHTASMTPTIPPRSAVIVHEGPVKVGEVVTFRTQSGVVTHRLVKRLSDGTYQTKGDANETVDPGTIRASQIIGSVVAAPRRLGYLLAYLKRPVGLASLIVAIVAIWLLCSLAWKLVARRAPNDQSASGPQSTTEAAKSPGNARAAKTGTERSVQDDALDTVPRRSARYAAAKTRRSWRVKRASKSRTGTTATSGRSGD